jgi:chaperonin GroEL
MYKQVNYGEEVNKKFLDGISKLSKVVGSTLGARGRNVAINERGRVHCTKDGITVANNFELTDPIENMGASLVREASARTNNECGDGSTGSIILTEAIYKNGLKHVSLGANPVQVKNGIDKAAAKIIEYVESVSKPISTKEEIKQVAKVSANGDEEIAEVIADMFSKIGKNGTIRVEDGSSMKMESKIVEGMVLEDRGYASAYFANNDALECYLDKPYILISDKRLNNINDLMPLLQSIAQLNRPLLIIGEEIDGDVLSTLVLNRLRGGLPICAIKAPSYGDNRKNLLNDIATLTGGQLVSDDTGIELQQVTADSGLLGQAKSITVTKTTTTIVGGYGDKEAIESHVKKIETELENVKDEYLQKKLQERLGKLTTGIGVIQCGASTEAELKEKKDRVDDAFNSAKNSIKSGVVPGGGVTLLNASKIIKFDESELIGDEALGVDVLIKSLTAPIKRILDNAGEKTDLIVSKLLDDESTTKGFDVVSKSYVDMFEYGIVDPTAVIVSEVKNASSIAGLMLTTDSSIVDIEEESDKKISQQMPMM